MPGFDQPGENLSYGEQLTLRKRRQLERGRNPGSGLELLEPQGPATTCGSCFHAIATGSRSHHYWKCELVPRSHGAATDIRLSWPACVAWTATDDGKSLSPAWIMRATKRRR